MIRTRQNSDSVAHADANNRLAEAARLQAVNDKPLSTEVMFERKEYPPEQRHYLASNATRLRESLSMISELLAYHKIDMSWYYAQMASDPVKGSSAHIASIIGTHIPHQTKKRRFLYRLTAIFGRCLVPSLIFLLSLGLPTAYGDSCKSPAKYASDDISTRFASLSWESFVGPHNDGAKARNEVINTGRGAFSVHWKKPKLIVPFTSPLQPRCIAAVEMYANDNKSFCSDYDSPIELNRPSQSYPAVASVKASVSNASGGGAEIDCPDANTGSTAGSAKILFISRNQGLEMHIRVDPSNWKIGLSMDAFGINDNDIRRVTDRDDIVTGNLMKILTTQQYNVNRQMLVEAFGSSPLQDKFFVLADRSNYRIPIEVQSTTRIVSPFMLFDNQGMLKLMSDVHYGSQPR